MHLHRNDRPARRMLCLACHHLAEPDTLLEGSDRLELAAWATGVLPGLLYCAWRHLCRAKACEACGSGELMRETRAIAARLPGQAPRAAGTRIRCERGEAFPWPQPLRTPRGRLRLGGPAGLAMGLAFTLTLAAVLGSLRPAALELAGGLACFALLWCAWQLQPMAWQRDPLEHCAAWDPEGRPIRIERA
jgi:hypothetical protein